MAGFSTENPGTATRMTFAKSPQPGDGSQVTPSSAGRLSCDKAINHRRASIAAIATNTFFLLLILLNVIRALRHAMWRDEMGTFQIALASTSLWELFQKLKYTTHPGLWYSL